MLRSTARFAPPGDFHIPIPVSDRDLTLRADEIVTTIVKLQGRIGERLPRAGLQGAGQESLQSRAAPRHAPRESSATIPSCDRVFSRSWP